MARKRQRGNGQGSLMQRKPGGCWIAKYFDHNGRRRERSTKTTDKRAAERILSKWSTEATLRRTGVVDARAEALASQGRRPIAEHLADFKAALLAKGTTPRHAELVAARAGKVIAGAGFKRWTDMSASRAMEYLKALRADTETCNEAGEVVKRKRGISAQTFNFYLQALKQFGRWMVKDRRAADNPFAYLEPLNVRTDRRHDRRALTPDELRSLIRTTEAGPERHGMTGTARAMLYRLAVETGLRAGELRSLTRASFELHSENPTVTVAAAYSKRRREDTLPLRPELAAELAVYLADKLPTAPAFKMPDADEVAKMIRADLTAAGIPYRDETGRVADFHALRHTFISNLAAGGVRPKVAQALARHSTITLTMDRYSHQYAGDERAALAALPDLTVPVAAVTKALGTDNGPAIPDRTPTSSPTSSSAKRLHASAARCDEGEENSQDEVREAGSINDAGAATSCDPVQSDTNGNGEAGIRTLGTGIIPYNGLANRPLQPLGHLSRIYNVLARKILRAIHA